MASNFKKKSDNDLEKTLKGKRKSLQQFRFGSSGSKVRNVKEGSTLRRDIARILTELNSRRLAGIAEDSQSK